MANSEHPGNVIGQREIASRGVFKDSHRTSKQKILLLSPLEKKNPPYPKNRKERKRDINGSNRKNVPGGARRAGRKVPNMRKDVDLDGEI